MKPRYVRNHAISEASPPTRGRGLKPVGSVGSVRSDMVAPHAGAWIETQERLSRHYQTSVAPHAGAWIETATLLGRRVIFVGRPPRGGVD